MRILFLLFTHSLFSAASFTHLFIAEQFLKASAFTTQLQERDFYLGNVFPDIQYLGGVERNQTHEFGLSMQDILESPTPFKAGTRLHSFVDEQRENLVLKWNIYDLLDRIEPRDRCSFLKLIESEILYDQTDPLRFVPYFQEIIEEETRIGLPLATHQKSHDFVVEHLYNRPSKLLQKLAGENAPLLRFSAETIQLWSRLLPEYSKQEVFQTYVRDLISFFNSEFVKSLSKQQASMHVAWIGTGPSISREASIYTNPAVWDLAEEGY
jgi:hypothetical protein